MLSEFEKISEREVWRAQVAHLHNAESAQLLTKISFVIFKVTRPSFF